MENQKLDNEVRFLIVNKCIQILNLFNLDCEDLVEEKDELKLVAKKSPANPQNSPSLTDELKCVLDEVESEIKSSSRHRALGLVLTFYPEIQDQLINFSKDQHEDIQFQKFLFGSIIWGDDYQPRMQNQSSSS